ncbi:MAG: hypothetical protein H0T74_16345 [Rubrobacteraceae bacterium]|nr:hypothetical protein [Rubrobacteraceae bacterium]
MTPKRCANGRGCAAFAVLGEPAKLSRYNPEDVCWECLTARRDAPPAEAAQETTKETIEEHEFLRLFWLAMYRRAGVENPNQLYRLLKNARPDGTSPSRSAVHAWFAGEYMPKPWLVAWARDEFGLSQKECRALAVSWIETHSEQAAFSRSNRP